MDGPAIVDLYARGVDLASVVVRPLLISYILVVGALAVAKPDLLWRLFLKGAERLGRDTEGAEPPHRGFWILYGLVVLWMGCGMLWHWYWG